MSPPSHPSPTTRTRWSAAGLGVAAGLLLLTQACGGGGGSSAAPGGGTPSTDFDALVWGQGNWGETNWSDATPLTADTEDGRTSDTDRISLSSR